MSQWACHLCHQSDLLEEDVQPTCLDFGGAGRTGRLGGIALVSRAKDLAMSLLSEAASWPKQLDPKPWELLEGRKIFMGG